MSRLALSEVHRDVRLPVTAAQLGVWVAQRMAPESPLYQCAAYYDSGPLDVEVFSTPDAFWALPVDEAARQAHSAVSALA